MLQQNMHCAGNMNQKSTVLLINIRIHGGAQDCYMPAIFHNNFPGVRHAACARHGYSKILLLWREDHIFKDKGIQAQIAHT